MSRLRGGCRGAQDRCRRLEYTSMAHKNKKAGGFFLLKSGDLTLYPKKNIAQPRTTTGRHRRSQIVTLEDGHKTAGRKSTRMRDDVSRTPRKYSQISPDHPRCTCPTNLQLDRWWSDTKPCPKYDLISWEAASARAASAKQAAQTGAWRSFASHLSKECRPGSLPKGCKRKP